MDKSPTQVVVDGIRGMIEPFVIRVVGYALSAILASFFYVSWIAALPLGPGSLSDRLFAASFVYMLGGFPAALVLMTLPWTLVVWIYPKARLPGAAYFASAGAFLMILMGCVASSVSPKLSFIEDQTFLEGFVIALERQGVCLALAGTIIGLGYWLAERIVTGERRRRSTVA